MLATCEGEQALNENLGPLCRLRRALDKPLLALAAEPFPLDQIKRADDWGEEVVEIMRDATRQVTHRVHLLRLPQGLFGLHLPRHVPAGADDAVHPACLIHHWNR